ncbi:MAG: cob(I)yrinic acid a,c-diamide adenosyltransferase [Myxococcales bacterium]|nr:cob(I)yrinic acid a,c-diamide adenosyltransferase [Myxococcales bacterium]HIK84004.1 cob(I)yrinic acid a,c-diamide adenosyltransferase [Myxococcales bacterium]
MKIYTRRGDAGQTDLFGGDRVAKDSDRVAAYGDVDETNAAIGLAIAAGIDPDLEVSLAKIQSALFDLGASLATPDPAHREKAGVRGVAAVDVVELESLIDRLEEGLGALKTFILPGGTSSAAAFHLARTVCRRAERSTVRLVEKADESVEETSLRYLNRLSDLLFVLARHENARVGLVDVPWSRREA